MKTLFLFVFPLFLFLQEESSCQKEKQTADTMETEEQVDAETELPTASASISDCMQGKIDFFIKNRSQMPMTKIFSYTSEGETYYYFDEGSAVDGPAYVLNEKCDTVCLTGGIRMSPKGGELKPCPTADENSRKTIWEKK